MVTYEPDMLAERAVSIYSKGRTIPTHRYFDPAWHELEVEKVWTKCWQMACREGDIPNVGDYYEYRIVGESILIVRAAPDRITAISNVCRHRATHLKSGCGNAREGFRCPFHGWKYDHDGNLLEITNDWDFPHIDLSENGLPQFRVETWGGFVFVCLDENTPPLREYMSPIPELCDKFGLQRWHRYFSVSSVVPANWKAVMEAFLESYHAPFTHPQSIESVDEVGTTYELLGDHVTRMITMTGSPSPQLQYPIDEETVLEASINRRQGDATQFRLESGQRARDVLPRFRRQQLLEQGIDLSYLSDPEIIDIYEYFLFPNFVFFPGVSAYGLYYRYRPNGNDPNSCIHEISALRPVPAGEEQPPDVPTSHFPAGTSFVDMLGGMEAGAVFDQDVSNLQTIQEGFKSAYYPGENLGLYQESLIRYVHEILDRYLGITNP